MRSFWALPNQNRRFDTVTDMDMSLEALRDEIDRLDDQLHDLLMRRADLVAQVAEAKRGTADAVMRPGREATVMRHLLERHHGPLPRAAVARIWREIISAMVRLQGPMTVAVYAPEKSVGYWDLARGHYGSSTPMTLHRSPNSVLRAVTENAGTAGVLPMPQEDDVDPWWPGLAGGSEDGPRIIARLPFVGQGEGRFEDLSALVVGTCESDETGEDASYLIVSVERGVSRAKLQEHLNSVGLAGHTVATTDSTGDRFEEAHFVEIGDFVARKDDRIGALISRAEGAVNRVVRVGGYAAPFRV